MITQLWIAAVKTIPDHIVVSTAWVNAFILSGFVISDNKSLSNYMRNMYAHVMPRNFFSNCGQKDVQ
jgi:hypothetical protein